MCNKSAISLTKNPVLHEKSKHIDLKFHYIRELVRDVEFELEFCQSKDQVIDIFPNLLSTDVFTRLKKMMEMVTLNELDLRKATLDK